MSRFLDVCLVIICAAAVVLGCYCLWWVVSHWFAGVLAPMEAVGIHWGFGVLIVLMALFFLGRFASLTFMVLGIYGAIWLLSWPWYGAILLYAPIFTISLFSGAIIMALGGLTFLLNALDHALRGR